MTTDTTKNYDGFTEAERAAMKERATELKSTSRSRAAAKPDGAAEMLAKITAMGDSDRGLAERLHAIVTRVAPGLTPKTYYGMPAWAKDGKIVCFFQPADKFKARYATLGFNDTARLDEGSVWPTSFALTTLTAADEKMIAALIRRAAG